MKRLIAILLFGCLLLCGCQAADPTQAPTPAPTQPTVETPTNAPTEAPTAPPTEAPTEAPTEPEVTSPATVTVYLLTQAVYFENGFITYSYDENHNIHQAERTDLEGEYAGMTYFREKDANGMACLVWQEFSDSYGGDSGNLRTRFADGKLQEDRYCHADAPLTGYTFDYDQKGDIIEKKEYYDGKLQSTVKFEYSGEELFRVYCDDTDGVRLFECRVEGGRILEKVCYNYDGSYSHAIFYTYDENGCLIQDTYLIDGENLPNTTYSYKAVEVSWERAQYLQMQQAELIPIV